MEKVINTLIAALPLILAVTSLFKRLMTIKQNNVSITLLSHEQKQSYYLSRLIIYYTVGILSFLLIGWCNLYTIKHSNSLDGNNLLIKIQSDLIIYSVFSLIIAIIFSLYVFYEQCHDNPRSTSVKWDFSNVFFIFWGIILLFFSFSILPYSNLDLHKYLLINVIISFLFLTILGVVIASTSKIFTQDKARLYIEKENKKIYLFEKNDNYIVGGNNIYIEDCSTYTLVDSNDLSNYKFYTCDIHCIYLSSSNITYTNIKKQKQDKYLNQTIAKYLSESKTPLNTESKIKITLNNNKTITYKINNCNECTVSLKDLKKYKLNKKIFLLSNL